MKAPTRIARLSWLSLWIAVALVVTLIAGIFRWGLIQTIVVVAFVAALLVGALVNRPPNMTGTPGATWLALTLIGLSPVAFGLLIFVITPTYFRPLYESAQGLTMLIAFGVAVVVANAAAQLAVRSLRHGHSLAGAALSSLTAVCVVPAFLIVIFGPAVAILLRPPS